MASLKDKLKSKINKQKNEPETMECFDETSLNVELIQGKSQLTELKICSAWTSKTNIKLPKFKCKWYNRTENNYQEIVGIEDEVYQPSVLDVDSIVEVTCIPQLPGVNYQGMPFLLKSKSIALSPQTEAEANRMMDYGKVRLIVSIKSARIRGVAVAPASQGMVVIEKQKMILSQVKFGQINDQVLKVVNLQQSTPQITLNRKMAREITIKFSQEEICTLYLKNHEVRDAFYLFLQVYNAKKLIEKHEITNNKQIIDEKVQQPTNRQNQILQQKNLEHNQLNSKEGLKQSTMEAAIISLSNQKKEVETQQKGEEPIKIEQNKQSKVEEMKQIKVLQSPKKADEKIIQKQNTTDLLQLMKLKDQIKRLQQQNLKLIKDCENQKNKVIDFQNKIQQLNERLNNASMNYFILEKEVQSKQKTIDSLNREIEKTKNIQNSKLEQIIYYQNEIKLMKDENNALRTSNATLSQHYQTLKASLSQYQQKYLNSNSAYSYKELYEELAMSRQAQKQLKLKYEFQIEEKDKMEQNLRSSRNLIQQIECQKKCIKKKYQSLTNEITSNNLSPTLLSRYSQKMSDKSPEASLNGSMVFEEMPRLEKLESFGKKANSQNDFREKQILELKKQIKDYVEENNLLRGVIQKQKKSSSRAHLKVELIDAKKIVSRLSESIAEKEMQIAQLKEINKQLNKKNRKLQQTLQITAANSTKI